MAEKNEDLRGKNLGVFICWLLGIGCLMGFNSMMIIEDYYISLFPKYHPTRLITISYQPLVLVTTAIYTYYEAKVNTRVRILAGYMTAFLCTFAMIAVDVASSGSGGIAAFVVICVIAGGFGVADGHVQAGLTGDLSLMCQEFLQSFFAGQAAAGAVTSVLRFITKGAFESTHNGLRKGAMLFCSIACFFVLTCVLLYAFVFPKLPIVKFYRSKAALEGSLTVTADLAAGGVQGHHNSMPDEDPTLPERMSGKQLLLRNADYALDVFLIYALSLAIVPGFVAEDTGSHSLGSWYALVLMASFNVLDLIGRYIPLIEYIKLTSRKGRDCKCFTLLVCTRILLHCEVRRSRLDDHVNIASWTEQWISDCMRSNRGTKRVQGARTERFGQHSCVFPPGGPVCWGNAWLAVAHRQRVVIKRINLFWSHSDAFKYRDADDYPLKVICKLHKDR